MALPFYQQNPGIGGLSQLTIAEAALVTQIASLGVPAGDRILFYDVSAGGYAYLTAGSGLDITGTTLTATTALEYTTTLMLMGG